MRRCPTTTAHNGLRCYRNVKLERFTVLGVNHFAILTNILGENYLTGLAIYDFKFIHLLNTPPFFFDLAVYDVLLPTARQNPSGRTPGFILSRVVMLPERRCISPNEYKVTANIRRYSRNGNAGMIFVYYLEWVKIKGQPIWLPLLLYLC